MRIAEALEIIENQYQQCRLRRRLPNGYIEQVAWIPRVLAKFGKYVRIGKANWQVVGCGAIRLRGYVEAYDRDYRTRSDRPAIFD